MDGSTQIALAGIAATALAGMVTPIVTAVTGHFSRRAERRASREEEFRAIAEVAATRMTEALLRLYRASGDPSFIQSVDARKVLLEDSEQLMLHEDRLDIRLGQGAPEARHYHAAVEAWQRAYSGPDGVTVGMPNRDPTAWQLEFIAAQKSYAAFKNAAAERIGPDASAVGRRREARRRRRDDVQLHGG
jgi:hypothetical protein